jgi:predicted nucleic acid-binding protein
VIVVDASALLTALVDAGAFGTLARRVLALDDQRHAPGLLDVEVASGIRGWLRAGRIDEHAAHEALADLLDYPITRHPERALLWDAFDQRDNLTIYDAVYVSLARQIGGTLLTADARLARAPDLGCPVRLLEP